MGPVPTILFLRNVTRKRIVLVLGVNRFLDFLTDFLTALCVSIHNGHSILAGVSSYTSFTKLALFSSHISKDGRRVRGCSKNQGWHKTSYQFISFL